MSGVPRIMSRNAFVIHETGLNLDILKAARGNPRGIEKRSVNAKTSRVVKVASSIEIIILVIDASP